jgi:hypothetical protein
VISPFGGKYVTVIEHAEELAKEREMEAGMSFVVITSSPQTRIRAAQMGARVFSNNDLKVSQMQTESQRAYKLNELVRFVAPQANIRDTRTVQRRR